MHLKEGPSETWEEVVFQRGGNRQTRNSCECSEQTRHAQPSATQETGAKTYANDVNNCGEAQIQSPLSGRVRNRHFRANAVKRYDVRREKMKRLRSFESEQTRTIFEASVTAQDLKCHARLDSMSLAKKNRPA